MAFGELSKTFKKVNKYTRKNESNANIDHCLPGSTVQRPTERMKFSSPYFILDSLPVKCPILSPYNQRLEDWARYDPTRADPSAPLR